MCSFVSSPLLTSGIDDIDVFLNLDAFYCPHNMVSSFLVQSNNAI
jgi:hypothetical protein